ncbi:hypothetical protein Ancab_016500, partial [Ancistrocladus abbreviatus]
CDKPQLYMLGSLKGKVRMFQPRHWLYSGYGEDAEGPVQLGHLRGSGRKKKATLWIGKGAATSFVLRCSLIQRRDPADREVPADSLTKPEDLER